MTCPIKLPDTAGHIDWDTFHAHFERNEANEIRNPFNNQFYPESRFMEDKELKQRLRNIDKLTGLVMKNPIELPLSPHYSSSKQIDKKTFDSLPRNSLGDIKNPFDECFYSTSLFLKRKLIKTGDAALIP